MSNRTAIALIERIVDGYPDRGMADIGTRELESAYDSYSWTPEYVTTDNGGTVCRDCVLGNAETFIDEYFANDVRRAITWLSAEELTSYGWTDRLPPTWHPPGRQAHAQKTCCWRRAPHPHGAHVPITGE